MIKTKIISSLERVFVGDRFDAFAPLERISVLRGERLNFQIVCAYDTVGSPAMKKTVRLTPVLTGTLAPLVQMRRVFHVPVIQTTHVKGIDDNYERVEPGLYPDILRPLYYGGKFSFTSHAMNAVWVEIDLPRDIAPGTHDLEVTVDGGDFGSATCRLMVEVIDAVLPQEDIYFTQWFHADCLANYYNVEVWSDRHFEIVENFARTARRNGINVLLTPVFTPPLDTEVGGERRTTQLVGVKVCDGGYQFDFSLLDRWIDMLDRCGIEYIEISHLFTQWGAQHAPKVMADVGGRMQRIFGWETDACGEAYVTFLRAFLTALLAHLKERGDDGRCFFHISDEPNEKHVESYTAAKHAVADLLEGYPVMDALSRFEFYERGIVEHPIPSTDHIKPFLEAGVPDLWTYYCTSQPINVSNRHHGMPQWRNRSIGMQMYKYGIAGFLQWGYNFYNNQYSGDPINPYYEQSCDYAFPGGDAFSVYPESDGTALESPRLVVFFEALQDIKAMKLAARLTSHETVVKAMETAFGREITFDTCAKNAETMLRVREAVNGIIKNAVEND